MKLFIIVVLSFISSFAFGQTTIKLENWNKYGLNDSKYSTICDVFITHALNSTSRIEMFGLVADGGFAEFLVGYGKDIIPDHLSVSGYVGIENYKPQPLRVSGSVYAATFYFRWLTVVEWNPETDFWYTSYLKYTPNESFSCGILARRYLGVGPRIDYGYKWYNFWGGVTYDFEESQCKAVLGVEVTLRD